MSLNRLIKFALLFVSAIAATTATAEAQRRSDYSVWTKRAPIVRSIPFEVRRPNYKIRIEIERPALLMLHANAIVKYQRRNDSTGSVVLEASVDKALCGRQRLIAGKFNSVSLYANVACNVILRPGRHVIEIERRKGQDGGRYSEPYLTGAVHLMRVRPRGF